MNCLSVNVGGMKGSVIQSKNGTMMNIGMSVKY